MYCYCSMSELPPHIATETKVRCCGFSFSFRYIVAVLLLFYLSLNVLDRTEECPSLATKTLSTRLVVCLRSILVTNKIVCATN